MSNLMCPSGMSNKTASLVQLKTAVSGPELLALCDGPRWGLYWSIIPFLITSLTLTRAREIGEDARGENQRWGQWPCERQNQELAWTHSFIINLYKNLLCAQQSAGHWRHKISVPQGLGLGPEPKVLMNGLVWPGQISSSVRQWSLRCLSWEPFSLLLFSIQPHPRLPHGGGSVPSLFLVDCQLVLISASNDDQSISNYSLRQDPSWAFFSNVCERNPGKNSWSWFWLVPAWLLISLVTLEKSFSFSEAHFIYLKVWSFIIPALLSSWDGWKA